MGGGESSRHATQVFSCKPQKTTSRCIDLKSMGANRADGRTAGEASAPCYTVRKLSKTTREFCKKKSTEQQTAASRVGGQGQKNLSRMATAQINPSPTPLTD